MLHRLPIVLKKREIIIFLGLLSVPLYFFSYAGYNTFLVMIPLIIIMQLYLLSKLKNLPIFQLLTLYAFIYFIYLIPYFYYDKQLSMWSEFQKKELFSEVCLQFYVFYIAICLSLKNTVNPSKKWLKDLITFSGTVTQQAIIITCTLCIIIYLFLFGGANVLNENNPYLAYRDNLSKSNVLALIVVMAIAFCYFSLRKTKYGNIIVLGCMIAVIYYAITRGYRVIIAPIGFLFLLLFFEQRISPKMIIFIALGGLFLLVYLNSLKMNEEFSISYVFSTTDVNILSHQADELYGAAAANGLINDGRISLLDRILLQIGLICQSIIPPSLFPNSMRFPMAVMEHTRTGGGGLFVNSVYVIFGYSGLFMITYLLSKLIQSAYTSNNKYTRLVAFIILIYTPNWFSYDLNVIIRFPIICICSYILLNHLNKINEIKNPNN